MPRRPSAVEASSPVAPYAVVQPRPPILYGPYTSYNPLWPYNHAQSFSSAYYTPSQLTQQNNHQDPDRLQQASLTASTATQTTPVPQNDGLQILESRPVGPVATSRDVTMQHGHNFGGLPLHRPQPPMFLDQTAHPVGYGYGANRGFDMRPSDLPRIATTPATQASITRASTRNANTRRSSRSFSWEESQRLVELVSREATDSEIENAFRGGHTMAVLKAYMKTAAWEVLKKNHDAQQREQTDEQEQLPADVTGGEGGVSGQHRRVKRTQAAEDGIASGGDHMDDGIGEGKHGW